METKKMLRKSNTHSEPDSDKRYMKEFKDIYGTEYYD